jgi:hypothetical protein
MRISAVVYAGIETNMQNSAKQYSGFETPKREHSKNRFRNPALFNF